MREVRLADLLLQCKQSLKGRLGYHREGIFFRNELRCNAPCDWHTGSRYRSRAVVAS